MAVESQEAKQNPLPIPPRFAWLRRGAFAFFILVLALGFLRFFWGVEANRRLLLMQSEASYDRHEPFFPKDFAQSSVPDAQNTAVPIQEAINQTDQMGRSDEPELDQWDSPAPSESELAAIETFIGKYRSGLKLVHAARDLPKTSWNAVPSFALNLPPLWANRKLARILILSAKLERARGHDGLALEDVEDELVLTRVADTSYPSVVTHLVTVGMSDLGTHFIDTSAMNLVISENPGQDASAGQVRALIKTLLDEQPLVDGAVRDFQGERAIMIDAFPKLASLMGPAEWLLEPMYKMDGVRMAQMRTAEAEACRQTNWTAARAKFTPERHGIPSNLDEWAHSLSIATGPMYQVVQQHFRMLTERRIAAIMLALRLYQVDHQGALPESLSELVPRYLAAVSDDPFDLKGAPIRYLPHRSPPVLYSVGLDGIDDHGSRTSIAHYGHADSPWDAQDAVFSLAPTPRTSPPQSRPSTRHMLE